MKKIVLALLLVMYFSTNSFGFAPAAAAIMMDEKQKQQKQIAAGAAASLIPTSSLRKVDELISRLYPGSEFLYAWEARQNGFFVEISSKQKRKGRVVAIFVSWDGYIYSKEDGEWEKIGDLLDLR